MKPGTVLLHRDFVFADGSSADKYLLILARTEALLLVAKTTSKGSRYRNDHGCQAGNHYPAFLLTLGCCFFPRGTWVCLNEFYELRTSQVTSKMVGGVIYKAGELHDELTRDVQACAAGCDDITQVQEAMIRAHFAQGGPQAMS